MSSIWSWLTNESNQKALAILGGLFAFLWSAGWAVFVYVRPPSDRKHAEGPRHGQTQRPTARAISSRPAFKIWLWGIAVVAIATLSGLNLSSYLRRR
jgi:hypothetical protein